MKCMLICLDQTADDLGNTLSKVNETCKAHHNHVKGTTDSGSQLNNNDYNPKIKG